MAVSMTGYGRNVYENERIAVKVEIKSVNNRYLDVNIRMPRSFFFMEDAIKKIIRNKVTRGKVDVNISLIKLENTNTCIHADMDLAASYYKTLKNIMKKLNIRGRIRPYHITSLPGVINVEDSNSCEDLADDISDAVEGAVEKLVQMKKTEGAEIMKDMDEKLKAMEGLVADIEKTAPEIPADYKVRMEKRIAEMLGDLQVADDRIAQEVAFMADRACIDEEITRIKSHMSQFKNNIIKEDSGKKLDFIIQEMNREANTIGSKANSLKITDNVVELKYIIEKLREQAQNLE
jgi:uncharacterized protein (TIGR00255 family)